MSVSASGPLVSALVYKKIGGGSEARSPNKSAERIGQITETPQIGSIPGPIFFALFVTCPEEENGFHCTNKLAGRR